MKKISDLIVKILLKTVLAAVIFFVVTFVAYFFNLDMKLTAAMEPLLNWSYDRVKRDTHI